MKITYIIIMFLVLFAPVASADFVAISAESLLITDASPNLGYHSVGVLFDTSIVTMTGGYIANAYVNDDATLNIQGLGAYDDSIGYGMAYGKSKLELHSGKADCLYAYETSTVSIFGGEVSSELYAYDDCYIDISGGTINALSLYGNATVDITDGVVYDLLASRDSIVNISGGLIEYVGLNYSSSVTFHGYDFHATGGLSLVGNELLGTGLLLGKYHGKEDWWMTDIYYRAGEASIYVETAPEPTTIMLLSLGILMGRFYR